MTARVDKVEALIAAALSGMDVELQDSTADEMFSASLTLTLRMVKTVLSHGADPARVRGSIQQILMHCVDAGQVH